MVLWWPSKLTYLIKALATSYQGFNRLFLLNLGPHLIITLLGCLKESNSYSLFSLVSLLSSFPTFCIWIILAMEVTLNSILRLLTLHTSSCQVLRTSRDRAWSKPLHASIKSFMPPHEGWTKPPYWMRLDPYLRVLFGPKHLPYSAIGWSKLGQNENRNRA